ncbi:MAG: PaaI family thioesterase [Eubacteriales bacterium]
MKTIEEVREMFEKDRFATENGARIISVEHLGAVCTLTLEPRHYNAMGAVMGGVYFTLADFAFAVASNWETPGAVSLSTNITFLSSAKGRTLTAKASCEKDGRSTCCYRVEVSDEFNLLSVVTVTGYKLH